MPFSQETLHQLDQPLDPRLIDHRQGQGNRSLAYLPGWTAIEQANTIFGYDAWGYCITQPPQVHEFPGNIIMVTVGVKVAVDGCLPREDVGVGIVLQPSEGERTADHYEIAIKGAATDAMKRALRSFGAQFGNSLYDKSPQQHGQNNPGQTQAQQGGGPPSPNQQLQYKVIALGVKLGWDREETRRRVLENEGRPLDELPPSILQRIITEMEKNLPR